jgi:hypothetical protein
MSSSSRDIITCFGDWNNGGQALCQEMPAKEAPCPNGRPPVCRVFSEARHFFSQSPGNPQELDKFLRDVCGIVQSERIHEERRAPLCVGVSCGAGCPALCWP